MRRWEMENYLYDKAVLTSYCLEKSLVFEEAEYDKFVTDIVNQNLKDETGRIKNFCGIRTNINPETFKLTLSQYVTEDMAVYKELEECIFERK